MSSARVVGLASISATTGTLGTITDDETNLGVDNTGSFAANFGISVGTAGDVNRDGRPDIYVSSDYYERDYLYINKGDGTFSDAIDRQMPVISFFSMASLSGS